MNEPDLYIADSTVDAPVLRSYRHSPAAENPVGDPIGNGQSLLLAWNNAVEPAVIGQGPGAAYVEGAVSSEYLHPLSHDRRYDLGFWLLRDGSVRCEGWSRLNATRLAEIAPYDSVMRQCSAAVKRACDAVAAVLLLTLLFPALLIVALLVKLDSPGPALFRHRRVGKDGKEFLIWKFRSMKVDVPKYEPSPINAVDARLTRIGRLIRRLSVDELPQLINVLKGEMSLVGPRPEMPFIVSRYSTLERGRLSVRPGITGLWQISPARAQPIHENLQYDLHYIHHQNLFLDCAILLRTITAVIHGVGAV